MIYLGSKRRIAKYIIPIILKDRCLDQWYVEPFCGGCNLISLVPTGIGKIANDINVPLISLLTAIKDGWVPPDFVSEDEYQAAKTLDDDNPLKGFIGFGCSFASKWFGGYARNVKIGTPNAERVRNYGYGSKLALLKQAPLLSGITFTSGNYYDVDIPPRSVVYCDPPYLNTTGYKVKFNHPEFYDWCELQHNNGHKVFISEYDMPSDRFTKLWERQIVTNVTSRNAVKRPTECLFSVKG